MQGDLATAAAGLQAHPWLHEWAHPVLERAVTCVERRCREQRSIINTATLHKAAVQLQQAEERRHLARIWQVWRHRCDWIDKKSPDCAAYDRSARSQLPDSNITRVCVDPWEVIVRLPPFGEDEDGLALVEPLSLWETTAIAAYATSADWTGGIVTLAAPPVVAQELLNPVRALDILQHTPGTGRTS
ncbi:hypothetical protein [Streptomyces pseudovenezuelae]|uniref:hypothetical protein n=1 Tax=Streptomyces pseudovenezuelae TaxID=67350 RepID=UPI002E81FFE3|nr:hypothetical protein [Streptomyces pseudovenezuelae]WUA93865.1 hypothetical protein OHO81_43930 [Streptomyces pseudovenezuelae]